jgi:hypothetical protein
MLAIRENISKVSVNSGTWWCMPVIFACGRLGQVPGLSGLEPVSRPCIKKRKVSVIDNSFPSFLNYIIELK